MVSRVEYDIYIETYSYSPLIALKRGFWKTGYIIQTLSSQKLIFAWHSGSIIRSIIDCHVIPSPNIKHSQSMVPNIGKPW